ncbi:GbsR/MarR family transcriptional regulator [Chloroflexota bacterium]
MDDVQLQFEEKGFVEEFGLFFEQADLPRMAGRILGWLLISDPPHQSVDELVETLMASKGSVSTMTRLLIHIGLIERISLPGVRHDYFRIQHGTLQHMLKQSVERIRIVRCLAERGLELTKGRDSLARQGLEEMRDMYAFFEREFPILQERWQQERGKHRAQFAQNGGSR